MKCHADDCPALTVVHSPMTKPDWLIGLCRCTAQVDLAELVAAAENLFKKAGYSPKAWDRLDAALKPFREEAGKKEKET